MTLPLTNGPSTIANELFNQEEAQLQTISTGILVDSYQRLSVETNDTGRISRALSDAVSQGLSLIFGPKAYTGNINLSQGNIEIKGSGRPFYDEVSGNFIGPGTILYGYINFQNQKHVKLSNLGVDARPALTSGMDGAITSGDTLSMNPMWHHVENVACIGNGYQADMSQNYHGMLFQSGTEITVKNVFLFNWYHGVAIRAGQATVDGVYAWKCGGTSIIVKSASGGNDTVQHVNIANVTIYGTTDSAYNRGGQIHVQSFNTGCLTQHVNISNVTSTNGGTACVLVEQVAGQCSNVTVINAKASNCGDVNTRATFDVQSATDVRFIGCDSVGATGYAFRNNGGQRVKVHSSFANSSGASDYTGNFDFLELNTILLISAMDSLNLDKGTSASLMQQSKRVVGAGSAAVGSYSTLLNILWTGVAGQYTSLAIDLLVTENSGGHARTQKFRIAVSRNGTATLEAAYQEDGTALVSAAGTQGTISILTDTSVANTLNIKIEGASYSSSYGYIADIVTDSAGRGLWQIQNLAA